MRTASALVVGLAVCAASGRGAGVAAQVVRGPMAGEVDRIFADWDRTDHPAVTVGVVRDGRVVHVDGYGMADLDQGIAAGPATVFDIASVSKHFTAFAVTTLAREGAISLDDPLERWIPELPTFGERITIRHLLHHVSGIRDWVELFAVAGWRFDDVITVRDILTLARHQQALNFPPGSAYAYSNTGYNILAEIVGRSSGMTFREWMDARAFGPLSMTRTHIHDRYNEVVPGRARSYGPAEDGEWELLVDNTSAVGSSSVFTSMEDMVRWMANFDGRHVGGEVLDQMLTRGVLTTGDTIPYAHGLTIGEYRGLRTVSHGGSWRGYRTHFLRFPDEALSVAVFGAFSTFDAQAAATSVAELFLRGRLSAAEPVDEDASGSSTFFRERETEPVVLSRKELQEYVGVYGSDELDTSYAIVLEDGGLVARHRINPEQALTPVGDDTFVTPGVRGQQTLTFEREGELVVGYRLAGRRFRGILFRRN